MLCKCKKVNQFERNRLKSIRVTKLRKHNMFSRAFSVIDRPDACDVRIKTSILNILRMIRVLTQLHRNLLFRYFSNKLLAQFFDSLEI